MLKKRSGRARRQPRPPGAQAWVVARRTAGGVTGVRCGMDSLAPKVQEGLGCDCHAGESDVLRLRRYPAAARFPAIRAPPVSAG